jgi:putative RNA 2'-phosphotransferase
MINEKETTHISKFLSLVLRHQPETIGIQLDENGWANVDDLIEKVNALGVSLNKELLIHVVEKNTKKRFAFDESQGKIRASQGHSIDVELGYKNQQPPKFLYHGTGEQNVESIEKSGIEKRDRQHVHLSNDLETAIKVGQRHGKPFVFHVSALDMYNNGYAFFLSENNVWLTDHVPTKYLIKND